MQATQRLLRGTAPLHQGSRTTTQHNPPRHPRVADIYSQIGIIFIVVGDAATAIEHFQRVITLEFPESTSEAHQWMARIFKCMEQYDEARFHLLQCLNIRQQHFSSNTDAILETYLALIHVEHITRHHEQKDLYLQQALCLADSTKEMREYFSKELQRIMNIPSPSTP